MKQKQHDAFLVSTYTSVKDIEALRDVRLDQLKGQRAAAEQYVEGLRVRLAALQTSAFSFRPYSARAGARRMPDDLAENLVRTVNELREQSNALSRREPAGERSAHAVPGRHRALPRAAHHPHAVSGPLARCQCRPECPKPPAPRCDAAKSSTTSSSTCTTGTTTSCAMRSPGRMVNGSRAAIPARHHELSLVVRIDEPDEVAEHDAVLVTQTRARQDHRGEPGIVEVDREAGRNELGTACGEQQRRIEAGAQVEAGRAAGRVLRQRELPPQACVEDAHLEGAACGRRRAQASAVPRLRATARAASSCAISAMSPRARASLSARGSSWRRAAARAR